VLWLQPHASAIALIDGYRWRSAYKSAITSACV
jgi:hypothetical protein